MVSRFIRKILPKYDAASLNFRKKLLVFQVKNLVKKKIRKKKWWIKSSLFLFFFLFSETPVTHFNYDFWQKIYNLEVVFCSFFSLEKLKIWRIETNITKMKNLLYESHATAPGTACFTNGDSWRDAREEKITGKCENLERCRGKADDLHKCSTVVVFETYCKPPEPTKFQSAATNSKKKKKPKSKLKVKGEVKTRLIWNQMTKK